VFFSKQKKPDRHVEKIIFDSKIIPEGATRYTFRMNHEVKESFLSFKIKLFLLFLNEYEEILYRADISQVGKYPRVHVENTNLSSRGFYIKTKFCLSSRSEKYIVTLKESEPVRIKYNLFGTGLLGSTNLTWGRYSIDKRPMQGAYKIMFDDSVAAEIHRKPLADYYYIDLYMSEHLEAVVVIMYILMISILRERHTPKKDEIGDCEM